MAGKDKNRSGEERGVEALDQAQRMETAARLARGIVHDFNNILGIAIGNLELAQSSTRDDPALAKRLAKVDRALQRGAELTERLLLFAADRPQGLVEADLNEVIRDQREQLAETLGPQIDLDLRLAEDLRRATINPDELGEVLKDLVLNARDAVEGVGRVTIESKNEMGEGPAGQRDPEAPVVDYVAIAVSDTGSGIAEDIAGRVFEPYFTTKERGKRKGLGLSGAYGFAARLGGMVDIQTAPGKGTTVRLLLPCAQEVEN